VPRSAAAQWRRAEFVGNGVYLCVIEFHEYLFETTDLGCDQAAEYTSGSFEDSDHATFKIYVKDNIELHAVCDIFSRLGTVDIAQRSLLRRAISPQRIAELRAPYSVPLDRICPQQWIRDLCDFASLWAVVLSVGCLYLIARAVCRAQHGRKHLGFEQ